jgi:hypothetical protein
MATRLVAHVTVVIGGLGRRFAPGPVDADAPIANGITLRQAVRADLLVDDEPKAAPRIAPQAAASDAAHEE